MGRRREMASINLEGNMNFIKKESTACNYVYLTSLLNVGLQVYLRFIKIKKKNAINPKSQPSEP